MNFEDRVGGQDETAAALFAAARAYRPPARARRRAWRALGLPVGLSLLAPGLAQAAATVLASAKGWIVVAGVVAATVGAVQVAHVVQGRREGRGGGAVVMATVATTVVPSARPVAQPPKTQPSLSPVRRGEDRGEGSATRAIPRDILRTPLPTSPPRTGERGKKNVDRGGLEVTRTASPPGSPPAAPASQFAQPEPSGLRAELALVGEARARLRAGDARATLALLADYPRRFPAGALAEEVDLLAMRALVAAGETARARQLGGEFLARHPGSPLAGAVRALLDSPMPHGLVRQEGDGR